MIKSAADIRIFLANKLPCYTNDSDEDNFVFIVRAEDIERVALELWRSLTPTAPDRATKCPRWGYGNYHHLPPVWHVRAALWVSLVR